MIKTLRKIAGLTQKELAEKMGVTQANISSIESNAEKINFGKLIEMIKALKLPLKNTLIEIIKNKF